MNEGRNEGWNEAKNEERNEAKNEGTDALVGMDLFNEWLLSLNTTTNLRS